MSSVEDNITKEYLRSIMKEGKPINELMIDIMKIGKEITDKVGHKNYSTIEDFLEDIRKGTSPLFAIDSDCDADISDSGLNVFAVRKCPIKDLMKEMTESSDAIDNLVTKSLDDFQIREGETFKHRDIGCYIMQQLRQMVVSSITIAGKPTVNYIHLACKRSDDKEIIYSEGDVKAIELDKEKIKEILKDHECVYAIFSTIEKED